MEPLGVLAALVVAGHLMFVVFAALGGLLAVRWPRLAWAHLPAAAWAVYIEISGGLCPLTTIENQLRARAGLSEYSGDFVARYLLPVLYPEGLTRHAQVVIAALIVALNVAAYAWVRRRRTTHAVAASVPSPRLPPRVGAGRKP